jgi:tubulin monoglycylase TTLL3/8
LRFCSQEYTLDSFHISIHLSNNSVQKYFTSAPTRSDKLPADNMWSSDEFESYLRSEGHGEVWNRKIVPGMKQAILCVLLCTQDQVEQRKTAFELYGADFMLTEDLQPWLIEINSSPSMARTTRATAELVDEVLEDTVKVVLDRKQDRNCDTGMFELIYRQQPIADPPQPDISLSVEGRRIKRQLNSTL